MMRTAGLTWLAYFLASTIATAMAQTANQREYITSSSPLPDGTRVTSTLVRDANGNFVPQVPAVPAPPVSAAANVSPPSAVLPPPNGAIPGTTVPGSVTPSTFAGAPPPANYMTRMPDAEQLAILQSAQQSNVPSLGYPGTKVIVPGTGTGRSCACGLLRGCHCCTTPRPTTPLPAPPQQTWRLPEGQVYPYPTLGPSPGGVGGSPVGSGGMPPSAPAVQYDPNNPSQPLIKMQNLPPGTYNGKGVFGHPAQYVDGQPMRNLFRFMFN